MIMNKEIKPFYTASLKKAAQTLLDQAETICADADTNFVTDITIRIWLDRDCSSTMDVEKTYGVAAMPEEK